MVMDGTMDSNCVNGFEDDTVMDYVEEDEEVEEKFEPNSEAPDEHCCTYTKSLETPAKKRRLTLNEPQKLNLCLTCCPKLRKVLEDCAKVCSACSHHCHENHELVEWYTKRNVLCDCPTDVIPKSKCKLSAKAIASRSKPQKTSTILNSTRKRSFLDADGQPEPETDSFFDTMQEFSVIEQNQPYTSNFPDHLIGFMYRLDLSMLCLLRQTKYKDKYPSLSFDVKNQGCDKFDIILRDEGKSIYVHIDHVDKYKFSDIGYFDLFMKDKRSAFINQYLDCFIRYFLPASDAPGSSVEYFVVYTNSSLDMTEELQLRPRRFKHFYPFAFASVANEGSLLRELLFTNDSAPHRGFYQFSLNESSRDELLKRLFISPAMQTEIQGRNLSEDDVKNRFLETLVLAANQPDREELNMVLQSECDTIKGGYSKLQKKASRIVGASPKMFYETTLLTAVLHDMFTRRKILSINSERQKLGTHNDITVHYKDKVAYMKVIFPPKTIGYGHLFTAKKSNCSLNSLFSLYLQQSHENLAYFIVYSSADMDIGKNLMLRKRAYKVFHPLKFSKVDVQEKEYKILRNRSYINEASLYRFSKKKSTRENLLELLHLPADLQNETLSADSEEELKRSFVAKLIFAVNQPDNKALNKIVKKEVQAAEVPYSCKELQEIALRWSESHELGPASVPVIDKLLEDIQNNRLSYRKNEKHLLEERQFAKTVATAKGPGYEQLLDFLVKERRLDILKSNGISLASLCSVLKGAKSVALKAFKDLYDLLVDADGIKTNYLTHLEENGLSFASIASILTAAKGNAAEAFKNLFDSWFDDEGKRTSYLAALESEGLSLGDVAKLLSGAGADAADAFKDLHGLWFDEQGNKSIYFKTLEMEGIDLIDMVTILSGTKDGTVPVFKQFYAIWFDEDGNKTKLLKTLEEEGLHLRNAMSVFSGTKANAATSFTHLYGLWFDADGKKTKLLRVLEENGVHLPCISNVLKGTGSYPAEALKDLYDICFDKDGNKTRYLLHLETIDMNLKRMFTILTGAGRLAARTFKNLYHLWFDDDGNKSHYILTLEELAVSLQQICITLNGTGSSAASSFKDAYNSFMVQKKRKGPCLRVLQEHGVSLRKVSNIFGGAVYKTKPFLDLYDLWFDEKGNKTEFVQKLEEEGVDLPTVANILSGVGPGASAVFKDFYAALFDKKGNKTEFLENLQKKGIDLAHVCNTLDGSGVDLLEALSEFESTFLDDDTFLDHFLDQKGEGKGFKLQNLFDILKRSGASIRASFEELHSVCFSEKGERTKLLDDLYKAGFKPSNLANLLNGTGTTAAKSLNKFHSSCFDEEGNPTRILDDFTKAGFTCSDLCNLLSETPTSVEILHEFCFVRPTKTCLKHLLQETDGFSPASLSKILQPSGADICSVLGDFHDVCFHQNGSRTEVLDDLYNAGFTSRQLGNILSMTGRRASFILKDFHKLCFGENYLVHLLAEEELFSPKKLSKMLSGTGVSLCFTFEKLHDLCFDSEGNRTKYFKKLMKRIPAAEVLDILQHESVGASHTGSGDKSFLDHTIKEELLEEW